MRNLVLLAASLAILAGCGSLDSRRAATQANPAPCPNAFVLADASRFVEFAGEEQSLASVRYSGEIEDISTSCRYYDEVPIRAGVDIAFAVGRAEAGPAETYEVDYFVAVTRTNRDVITKRNFRIPVTFAEGQRVVQLTQSIDEIVIPRAGNETSGVNFEIAVGFTLDRQQVLFNRSGRSLKFPES